MKCNWFKAKWHKLKRRQDRINLTVALIKTFPEPADRIAAWDRYMLWQENGYWRCPCSAEAKHPVLGIPLKEYRNRD